MNYEGLCPTDCDEDCLIVVQTLVKRQGFYDHDSVNTKSCLNHTTCFALLSHTTAVHS